jgi:hypothetical protein
LRGDRVHDRATTVHDNLEQEGWSVEIADAQKVTCLALLACKTDKIDSKVLAMLSHRDLVPAIWLPDPSVCEERELARFHLHPVKHKSALKCRIHCCLSEPVQAEPPTEGEKDVMAQRGVSGELTLDDQDELHHKALLTTARAMRRRAPGFRSTTRGSSVGATWIPAHLAM